MKPPDRLDKEFFMKFIELEEPDRAEIHAEAKAIDTRIRLGDGTDAARWWTSDPHTDVNSVPVMPAVVKLHLPSPGQLGGRVPGGKLYAWCQEIRLWTSYSSLVNTLPTPPDFVICRHCVLNQLAYQKLTGVL